MKRKQIFCIFSILIILCFIYIFTDEIRFNSKTKKHEKYVNISFVVLDSKKTNSKNIEVNDDNLLNVLEEKIPVKKQNKYYVAKIDAYNNILFDNIKSTIYTLNDMDGNIIKDLKYDKDSKLIYIPEKYYKQKKYKDYNGCPVKIQFKTLLEEKEYNKINIGIKIKKFFTKNKKIKIDNESSNFKIQLFNYKKGYNIKKEDINIYLNNSKIPLNKDCYYLDNFTGVVKLKFYPIYANDIKIEVRKIALIKNKVFNVFNIYSVSADDDDVNDAGDWQITSTESTGQDLSLFDGKQVDVDVKWFYSGRIGGVGNREVHCSEKSTVAECATLFEKTDFDAIVTEPYSATSSDSWQDAMVYIGKLSKSVGYQYSCPTESNPNKKCDGTATLTINVDSWLVLRCAEAGTAAKVSIGSKLPMTATLKKKSSKKLEVGLSSDKAITTQKIYGKFNVVTDITHNLKVAKYHAVLSSSSDYSASECTIIGTGPYYMCPMKQKNILYRLYTGYSDDGKDCNGKVKDRKYTNASGIATFKKLASGTYCIKEIFNEDDSTSKSSISKTNYLRDANCDGNPYLSDSSEDKIISAKTEDLAPSITVAGSQIKGSKYCNIRKYYSFTIQKKDRESSIFLDGASFNVSNDSTGTQVASGTTTGGIINVCGLTDYTSYTITETSVPNGYWLDTPTSISIAATSLTPYLTTQTCPATAAVAKTNTKKYTCLKVKKIDKDTKKPLANAGFTATCNGVKLQERFTDSSGVATIFTNDYLGSCNVSETTSPDGYGPAPDKSVATKYLTSNTFMKTLAEAQSLVESVSSTDETYCDASPDGNVYENTALNINWYKYDEKGNKMKLKAEDASKAAQFTVKNGTNVIYHTGSKQDTEDGNGVTKSCYVYSKTPTSYSTYVADTNGEVCVRGLPKIANSGKYTVTEIKPAQYHTFSDGVEVQLEPTNIFENPDTQNKTNIFTNLPTSFQFDKNVIATIYGDTIDTSQQIVINGVSKAMNELTTEELKTIGFEIYLADANNNPTGNALTFVYNAGTGIYEYSGNSIDGPGAGTNVLHLNESRNLKVNHLEWGKTYVIREVNTITCSGSDPNCIGYYYPNYGTNGQTSSFTITTCSNGSANAQTCSSNGYTAETTKKSLNNTPTEIKFTKADFYKYNDQADIEDKDRPSDSSDETVEFENDKERSDFDRIKFQLRDSTGNPMTLKFIGNSGDCKNSESYSLYRYVSSDTTNEQTELHTCGGHMRITNLCRGKKYKIVETEVPEDSVYVKENTNGQDPSVEYDIPCTESNSQATSTTSVINDKPTRVRLEKRDAKYGYVIPDDTTTFRVYRCPKGEECHPSEFSTDEARKEAGIEIVKFYPKGTITGDAEDPTDFDGNIGVQVYRRMSDSDIDAGTENVTDLHPYKGILVLRYLQAGYNYVALETVAPRNYTLPSGKNAETLFSVVNDTVNTSVINTPNKPTSLLIKKYDSKGNLLPGAEFKIYKSPACDPNKKASAQTGEIVGLKTIRDGIYEAREKTDTNTVKTCTDREDEKCSDINVGEAIRLTYTNSLGTWSNEYDTNVSTKDGEKIEIKEGVALVKYLEYGKCYIVEETKAPEGYTLPEREEERYSMVTIEENTEYAYTTYYNLVNKPTPFQFYKFDEYNQLIDGAEFKLQKLDKHKKYHDVTVTKDDSLKALNKIEEEGTLENGVDALNNKIKALQDLEKEGVPFYKVDSNSNDTKITTNKGTAIVYYLSEGQYRILETKAPEGKELPKNPNIATFFVDSNGNVYGNSIITNRTITQKIQIKNSASAEFIINIQTGQTVIRYGLIISLLVALISGLIIVKKKME